MIPPHIIVGKARSYLGVPFKDQGRTREFGVDCVGLLVCIGQDLGLRVTASNDYSLEPQGQRLVEELRKNGCEEVPRDQILPGDILVFWYVKRNVQQHAGIFLSSVEFIHAFKNRAGIGNVRVEEFTDAWRNRLMSIWRYAG